MVWGKDIKRRITEQKQETDRSIPPRPRSNLSQIVPKTPDTNASPSPLVDGWYEWGGTRLPR